MQYNETFVQVKREPKKAKGRRGEFGKVRPNGCLHSSDNTKEEPNKEKQNEIRIWPKKKQGYGYYDRSSSIRKNLSKSFQVNGALKHPKYAEKSDSNSLTSHLLKKTLPAMHSTLNYLVMQYLLNAKNKTHFNLIIVLNHFMALGIAEPSMMHRNLVLFFFVENSTKEKKCLAEAKKRSTHFVFLDL
ncbi:hypothetical protein CDL12_17171 [Handroanthus impetiginosus]|uniref:Uncharacterized protein n=1 Tax=Handroanthus impetiginosus TaxID=429701 RepID=A0A2G9GY92_9LAMI|nr:hypothetical protein CDL12_17171 [Handroanthus impetiginosus]